MSDALQTRIEQTLLDQDVGPDFATVETIGAPRAVTTLTGLPSLQVQSGSVAGEGRLPRDDSEALVLTDVLGRGGMGAVHLAHQASLERDVAVKLLHANSELHAERLVFEARITGRLEHPNVVPVHTLGIDAERGPVVVMKRVHGRSWDALLADDADVRLDDPGASGLVRHLEILTQVCHAVEFAHSRGIVHRDIKPSNVMIGGFGEVYLVDWGVALDLARRDQARAAVVGTAAYMAPEMVSGRPGDVDARTDVFLLGATLHEILTGQPRHTAPGLVAALVQAHAAAPTTYDAAVPSALGELANRACHRELDARHPDVASFRQALGAFLAHRSVHTLVTATMRRVEALEALVGRGVEDTTREAHDSEVDRLFEQLRFAHEQLQTSAPALPDLPGLRRRMLSAMLDHELERRNIPGAQRLARELGESLTEARRAALAALEREAQDTEAVLRAHARAQDPSLSRRQRLIVGGSIMLFALGVLLQGLTQRDFSAPSPPLRLFVTGMIPLLLASGAGLIWKRRITVNEYNRRYFRMFFLVALGTAVSRVCAWLADLPSGPVLRFELLMIGIVAMGARLPSRVPVVVGLAFLLAAVAGSVWPDWAGRIYSIVTLVGGSIVVFDTVVRQPARVPPD